MGSDHSDHGQSWNAQDWEVAEQTQTSKTWQNKRDRTLQLQQYEIFPSSQQELEHQRQLYYLRKNNPYLVASHYFNEMHQEQFCSSHYKAKIYLQNIPFRLSDIEHIPHPDYIHFYHQALQGFRQLSNQQGPFTIEEENFGVNQKGVVKVWLNQDFSKKHIHPISETAMVRNIIETIQKNTDESTKPGQQPNVKTFLYRRTDALTFDQALQEFNSYIHTYYSGIIPGRLDCVERQGGAYAIANKIKNTDQSDNHQKYYLIQPLPLAQTISSNQFNKTVQQELQQQTKYRDLTQSPRFGFNPNFPQNEQPANHFFEKVNQPIYFDPNEIRENVQVTRKVVPPVHRSTIINNPNETINAVRSLQTSVSPRFVRKQEPFINGSKILNHQVISPPFIERTNILPHIHKSHIIQTLEPKPVQVHSIAQTGPRQVITQPIPFVSNHQTIHQNIQQKDATFQQIGFPVYINPQPSIIPSNLQTMQQNFIVNNELISQEGQVYQKQSQRGQSQSQRNLNGKSQIHSTSQRANSSSPIIQSVNPVYQDQNLVANRPFTETQSQIVPKEQSIEIERVPSQPRSTALSLEKDQINYQRKDRLNSWAVNQPYQPESQSRAKNNSYDQINSNDGKSSDQFLKLLQQIKTNKISSSSYGPSASVDGYKNYEVGTYGIENKSFKSDSYQNNPSFQDYTQNNKNQSYNYQFADYKYESSGYNQQYAFAKKNQGSHFYEQEQTYLTKAQDIGKNTESNIIVGYEPEPTYYQSNHGLILDQNLDMKYSMTQEVEDSPNKRNGINTEYRVDFDPQILADLHKIK